MGKLSAAQGRDFLSLQKHLSGSQGVHTAQNIQQRGLTSARLTENHRDLTLVDGKAGILQRMDFSLAAAICLIYMFKCYKSFHKFPHLSPYLLHFTYYNI